MSIEIDPSSIKELSPINSLNSENIQDLIKKVKSEVIQTGHYLFKIGDMDKSHVYVIKGDIELVVDKKIVKTISGGSAESKHPLAHSFPRTVSARAKTPSVIVRVNSDMLDIMLTWDQTGSYSVESLEESDDSDSTDWMTRILQTRAFHRIPPANIQAMFMRMETAVYKPGDIVIQQDDPGDYFYIIKEGRCLVTRATPANPKGVKLATLSVGDSFGEEALISDSKRNATVTMLSDGHLMRLNKDDFNSLLNEPLLNWVSYIEAKQIIENGGLWLDVRLPAEYKAKHIKGTINIPLIFLRMKANSLDTSKKYVIYCDTGRRSSAASFLLNEKDISSYVLTDGVDSADSADIEE
ncbi:MAG: cyclic nucleotide-binding domain-containing protein [Gammaproteobacteria bacterium]|nr:cyclic nucleotide-binding domain-containing protein [Gammaproteobacteria bacterium]MBL6999526.1 cyclic nucleotide-binding domain-containing protein [Gammaproteobacteria bacterium]